MKETKIKIYQTENYSAFRFINGNRPVKQLNVRKIVTAYKSGIDLFKYNPILIDRNFVIYDGQHRFEACKSLKIPVYYIYIDPIDLPKLVLLNDAQMKWDIEAFTMSFIKQGLKDYQTVMDFSKRHKFSISLSAEVLKQKQPHMGKEYITGFYKIGNVFKAEDIANQVHQLRKIDKKMDARVIVRALIELSHNDNFDFHRFLKKLELKPELLKVMGSVKEQIRNFESVYNFNVKKTENYIRLF
jgi:hypothetical protein